MRDNGLIGIERLSLRERGDDRKRIAPEIHGLRVQEPIDGPGKSGHIRVHDHNPTAWHEDAKGLIKKVPHIFQVVQYIEQHDV